MKVDWKRIDDCALMALPTCFIVFGLQNMVLCIVRSGHNDWATGAYGSLSVSQFLLAYLSIRVIRLWADKEAPDDPVTPKEPAK